LTFACTGLVERRRLGPRPLKFTFNAENFICKLLRSISRHFGAIHSWNLRCSPKSRKKFTKTFYFGGWRSLKVIYLEISKKLVTSACYDKQHVCAYLQPFSRQTSQYRQNNIFLGFFCLLVRGDPPKPSGVKFCLKILESLSHHVWWKPDASISHLVLRRYRDVTDTRHKTPRQNYHS